MDAGRQAYERGDYDEAEKQVLRALLRAMGRDDEATELETRAQAIRAKIAQ